MGRLLFVAVFSLVAMLFVSGPDQHDNRLYKELWNLGHVVLFALLALMLMRIPRLRAWSVPRLLLLCGLLAPVTGLAIEWLQLLIGRDFEYQDVLADTLGAYCGLILHFMHRPALGRAARVSWGLGLALMLAFSLRHLVVVVIDQHNMQQAYPWLADFETPYELSRWESHLARLSISTERASYHQHALRVEFLPGEYPSITLFEFPSDWSGYKFLVFNVFNTRPHPVQAELKIYDGEHALFGFDYTDRYNRVLTLVPGWNNIEVRTEHLLTAPEHRDMNLQNIKSFNLFLEHLDAPLVMYVDGLQLMQ